MKKKEKAVILTSIGIASVLLNFFGMFRIAVLTFRFEIYLLLSVVLCTVPIAVAAFIGQRMIAKRFDNKIKGVKLVFFCSPLIAVPLYTGLSYNILWGYISDSSFDSFGGYMSLMFVTFAVDLAVFVWFGMLEGFADLLKGEK